EGDTQVGADDAEQRAEGVECLGDEVTAPVRIKHCGVNILSHQPCPHRIVPAAEEREADQKNVEPVDQKGDTIGHELGQQPSRKRYKCDRQQEPDMDPGEMAIAAGDEMVELRLLRDPEDAERQKAHNIRNKAKPKRSQLAPQYVLMVLVSRLEYLLNRFSRRHMKVEHEQRHRDREDAVA